ncbi:MAG: 50S ribosomal protein L32 [Bdellovibrionales bacterium]|nr:50S ribosomal protein L32 [Bdellovibrionales bacterium]
MPQPKKKTSKSRRNMRRSHDGLSSASPWTCSKTGEMHQSHRAYKGDDGAFYYKGKAISAAKDKDEA